MKDFLSSLDSECVSDLRQKLIQIAKPVRDNFSGVDFSLPEGTSFPLKSTLESLLPQGDKVPSSEGSLPLFQQEVRDFALCCAALASADSQSVALFNSIPCSLSNAAKRALHELSKTIFEKAGVGLFDQMCDEGLLAMKLMPEAVPLLKGVIKDSSIDYDIDEIVAASAKAPVGTAIIAARQFRWLVTQVQYPYLGKFCSLIIPCALTALDHWSPEVKDQAIISFIHLVKNVNVPELGCYEDVILDASCQNIASSDELWSHIVEMSTLFLMRTQRRNPRSPWFEKIINQMLDHLQRQTKDASRRIAWLQFIDPVFNAMGLILVAHFRRIFPLFFMWMHEDDDETVMLVLERIYTLLKMTWIRKSSFIERLVDELTLVYKESKTRKDPEAICTRIMQIFGLIHQCMGQRLEAAWHKHKDDPRLRRMRSAFEGPEAVQ